MAGSVNRATILGNLGQDPDIRHTQDGRKIVNLSIATSEQWTDKQSGERRERTQWHRIVLFNEGLAGVAEKYLKKGSKCLVEGQIETRKWTDQSGQDRYTTEIVVRPYRGELVLLGDPGRDGAASGWGGEQRSAAASGQGSAPASASASRPLDDLDDEIPF